MKDCLQVPSRPQRRLRQKYRQSNCPSQQNHQNSRPCRHRPRPRVQINQCPPPILRLPLPQRVQHPCPHRPPRPRRYTGTDCSRTTDGDAFGHYVFANTCATTRARAASISLRNPCRSADRCRRTWLFGLEPGDSRWRCLPPCVRRCGRTRIGCAKWGHTLANRHRTSANLDADISPLCTADQHYGASQHSGVANGNRHARSTTPPLRNGGRSRSRLGRTRLLGISGDRRGRHFLLPCLWL
jgi:hypothetical protein